MTSKFKISEQIRRILQSGASGPNASIGMQELIISVSQAFATVVKLSFFANKNDGYSELSGQFIYSFKNVPIVYDEDLTQYYSVLPSSYIDLPHEIGIQFIGLMKSGNTAQSQTEPMVRVFNGFPQLARGLALETLQTRKAFYVEGSNIIYLGMTAKLAELNVLMKLAVSLEGIDEDTQISLSPEIQKQIIDMVVAQYMPEKQIADTKIANNLS